MGKWAGSFSEKIIMHYKNGRSATVGDPVVGPNYGGVIAGTVVAANPGSASCNLNVRYISRVRFDDPGVNVYPGLYVVSGNANDGFVFCNESITTVTAHDFMHAEDLLGLANVAEVAEASANNFKEAQALAVAEVAAAPQ